MNDTDDAALGDRTATDEELADAGVCVCPDDWGSPVEPPPDPTCPIHGDDTQEEPTVPYDEDTELDAPPGYYGRDGGDHSADRVAAPWEEDRTPDESGAIGRPVPASGPPRRMWPGHEDCGGIHHYDDEDGYVCRCGTFLGMHWPDTEEIERTVAEVQARPRADIDARDPIRSVMQPLARDNITPAEVEGHLADILTRLETGLQYERWCADEFTRLKLERDVAMAKTVRDRRGGSADVRRAEALIENEDLVRECDLAEGRWKAVRDTMHTVRSLQHGYQSILKSVRDTVSSPAQGRGGYYG